MSQSSSHNSHLDCRNRRNHLSGFTPMFSHAQDSISIQRSVSIQSQPEKIFGLIHDFRCWEKWSPWEKLDPHIERSFSGNACGQGAIYAWTGKVGTGQMEITTASPSTQINIQLKIVKPFQVHNMVEFTLQSANQITVLTWDMHGPKPNLAKLIGIFFNMDKFLGKDLEKGLQNLKHLPKRNKNLTNET
jgi:hypothetical protein